MGRAFDRLAARLRPVVPERLLPHVHAARSLVGDGPVVGPPGAKRVLVVAPHPDDESLAFGGTIAALTDAGATVTVVFVTDGDATRGSGLPGPEVARRRAREGDEACALLGVTDVVHLRHPDGAVAAHLSSVVTGLRALAERCRPELVLVPWPLDGHPDHRAAAAAACEAVAADVPMWGGEVWTPLPATRVVDVTPQIERKERAILTHRTALHAFDATAIIGLNRYRSVHGLSGEGYAEAFVAADAATFRRLLATA